MDLTANRLANAIVWFLPWALILGGALFFALKFFDKSGKVRWEASLDKEPLFLKAHGQTLFCFFEDHLSAYDILSGQVRWDISQQSSSYLPYLSAASSDVITADRNHLYRINIETGKILIALPVQGFIISSPVSDNEFIYLVTAEKEKRPFDYDIQGQGKPYQILKIRRSDLQILESYSLKLATPEKLTLEGKNLFILGAEDYTKNILYCISLESGKINWQKKFRSTYIGRIEPAISRDLILIAGRKSIGLYSSQGLKKWQKKFSFLISEIILTKKGYPVIHSSGKLLGLDPVDGSVSWDMDIGTNAGGMAVNEDIIYAAGISAEPRKHRPNEKIENMLKPVGFKDMNIPQEYLQRRLYAIDGSTGKIRWTLDRVSGNPLSEKGLLYLLNVKGSMNLIDASKFMGESSSLYCVNPLKGKKLWQSVWEGFTLFVEISPEGCFAVRSVQFFSPGDIMRGPKEPPKFYLVALYP